MSASGAAETPLRSRSKPAAHAAPSRLAQRFAALRGRDEAAFVPFVMAGDRGLDTTARVLDALVESGADAIEIGVPFSDPMADGPVLQRAAERALRAGANIHRVLELVVDLRRRSDVPIVLFGYANPFLRFGPERLAAAAAGAGVDALLCVDMPPDEADELRLPLREQSVDMIFLLAPTSTRERIERVLRAASGFVYFVSVTGVTGVKAAEPVSIEPLVREIRAQAKVPIGVGFGVATAEQAAALSRFADAVIVGSSLARLIEQAPDERTAVERVAAKARELKAATRRGGLSR